MTSYLSFLQKPLGPSAAALNVTMDVEVNKNYLVIKVIFTVDVEVNDHMKPK